MADLPLSRSLVTYAKAPSEAGSVREAGPSREPNSLDSALDALTKGKNSTLSAANTTNHAPTANGPLAAFNGRNSPIIRRSETPNRLTQRQTLAAAARIPLAPNARLEPGYPPISTPRINRTGSPRSVHSVENRPAIWSPSVLTESDFNPPSTMNKNRYQHMSVGQKKMPPMSEDVFAGTGTDATQKWSRRDSRPPIISIMEGKVTVNGSQAPPRNNDDMVAARMAADYRGSPDPLTAKLALRDREQARDSRAHTSYPASLFDDDDDDEEEQRPVNSRDFRAAVMQRPVAPRPIAPHRQAALNLMTDDLDSLLDEDELDDANSDVSQKQHTPKGMRKASNGKAYPKPHASQQQGPHGQLHVPPSGHQPISSVLAKIARATSDENFRKRRRPSYDYDDKALEAMDYGELKKQPFDYDPAVAPALQMTLGHGETLPAQLVHYKTRTETDQRDFFSRMTVRDWERSGDWFLDQFGDLVQNMIQARKERRATVARFEAEIAEREEQVRVKHDSIDRKMNKMKQNGMKVVEDEFQ